MTDTTHLEEEVAAYQAEVRQLREQLAELRGRPLHAVPDEEPPRRMTQGQILAAFVETMRTRATGEHSTVKLTRNAKGDTQIEVSIRTGESEDVATVEDAAAKARSVYDAMRMLYPLTEVEHAEAAKRGAS